MNMMMAVLAVRPVDLEKHGFLLRCGGTAIQRYAVVRERSFIITLPARQINGVGQRRDKLRVLDELFG